MTRVPIDRQIARLELELERQRRAHVVMAHRGQAGATQGAAALAELAAAHRALCWMRDNRTQLLRAVRDVPDDLAP